MVDFLREVMEGWDIDRIMGELLDAAFFGYQPAELTWVKRHDRLQVSDIVGKPPEWFSFDDGNQLRFRANQAGLVGELLPPRKFVVATQDATFDNPYGFPDLSMCFWPVAFKKGGWRFWMRFTEKYASPWLVGKHPRGTADAEIDLLLDSLDKMVEDAVAVIPNDSTVEIIESAGKGASSDIYRHLIELARAEIVIALLGQNQTTEAETTHASAQAGLEVAADIRDGDAAMVMSAINQVLRFMVELNFGEVPMPSWALWAQETIDETQAKRDLSLSQAGAVFTPQYFMREYNPQPGDLRESAVMAPLTNAAFAETQSEEAGRAEDELERALESLITRGQRDKAMEPILAPLFAAVEQGQSPQALMGMLAEMYPRMAVDRLQAHLARILFVANIAGRLSAQ